MNTNLIFAAVFLVQSVSQSVSAPTAWAGPENVMRQTRWPQNVRVSSNPRGRLTEFEKQNARDLAERIISTAPGSFSESDQAGIREAIEGIAASLSIETIPNEYSFSKGRYEELLLVMIRSFMRSHTSITPELRNKRAARILRLLIELDLVAAATDFDADVDLTDEAIAIDRTQRASNFWEATTTGGLTAAILISVYTGVPLVLDLISTGSVDFTKYHAAGLTLVLGGLATYATARFRRGIARSQTESLLEKKHARDPKLVHDAALAGAARAISEALSVPQTEGHPERPLLDLLRTATSLSTRELFERSACELGLIL